jgi:hypothetical protein
VLVQEMGKAKDALAALQGAALDVPAPDADASEEAQLVPRMLRLKQGTLLLELGKPEDALAVLREAMGGAEEAPAGVTQVQSL